MAIYHHLDSKDDLLLLMEDAAYGPPVPLPARPWRAAITEWSRNMHLRFEQHPWLLDVPTSHLPPTPNKLLWFEQLLKIFAGTGLASKEKLSAALLTNNLVLGTGRTQRDLLANPFKNPSKNSDKIYLNALSKILNPRTYPEVLEVLGDQQATTRTAVPEAVVGIEHVLHVLELLIRSRPGGITDGRNVDMKAEI